MKKLVKNIFSIWPLCNLVCWHGRRRCGKVALTFDDGPNDDYTRQVLDILKVANVTATFFLEGRWVEKNPQLVAELIDAGHEIGNHGYDHGDDSVLMQVKKCDDALKKVGVSTNLFRPPLGKLSCIELVRLRLNGYRVCLWSVDLHDSMRHEGKWAVGGLDYSSIQGGDIILMHDDNPICVTELPEIIKAVRNRCLEFVSVSEINR